MEELLNPVQAETVEVVDIQFRPGQKVYYFDPAGMRFQAGDHVVMDTARGAEFGFCTSGNHSVSVREVVSPLRKVLRKATAQDERIHADNRTREKRAYEICMQKIADHQLDMQLVSAECAFDASMILFYFTADERVDFRELVKDLAGVFHTRIELRQIGVRDKAKMVGGLGICGRPFCCASFLDDFQPVSIKMAKTQNLSLNPTKISGTCGRLMCCLKYEQDTYEELIRTSPKAESFVDTPDGRGTVVESEILRQRVKVQMENNPETISVFSNDEIAVLRSGKAKKTDPPIPADLAPISGSGRKPRPRKEEEEAPVLEAIRFRYSTESIAEESGPAAEPVREEPEAEERRSGHSRRRRGSRADPAQAEKQEKNEKPEKPEKPAEEPAAQRSAKSRRDGKPRGQRSERKEPEKADAPKQENPKRGNSNRPRKQRPAEQADRPAQQPDAPKAEGETKQTDGEAKKSHRRSNFHRHRRPKTPQA